VGRRKWRELEIRKAKVEDGNGKKCGLRNADRWIWGRKLEIRKAKVEDECYGATRNLKR